MVKVVNAVSAVLILCGFLLICGTVGASDHNLIDFETVISHIVIGVTLVWGGMAINKIGGGQRV